MLTRIIVFSIATLSISFAAIAQTPKTIIYPSEAIVDSGKLKRAQFNERYPGIDITGIGLVDEGWYVRYYHEQLVYLFGPFEDLDFARIQKETLDQIRLSAVLKNPKLSSSVVDIIEFKFSDLSSADDSKNINTVE